MAPDDIKKDSVDADEAARMIGCSYKTLLNWRVKGIGPRGFKYMGRLYFKIKEIEAYKRSLIKAS